LSVPEPHPDVGGAAGVVCGDSGALHAGSFGFILQFNSGVIAGAVTIGGVTGFVITDGGDRTHFP
jgi:hypothetical protein